LILVRPGVDTCQRNWLRMNDGRGGARARSSRSVPVAAARRPCARGRARRWARTPRPELGRRDALCGDGIESATPTVAHLVRSGFPRPRQSGATPAYRDVEISRQICHWGSPARADAPWTGHRTSDARAAALRGEHAGKPAIWLATDAYNESRHARLQGLPPSTWPARPRHGFFEMKLVCAPLVAPHAYTNQSARAGAGARRRTDRECAERNPERS
jgi:hypothetical protein